MKIYYIQLELGFLNVTGPLTLETSPIATKFIGLIELNDVYAPIM